MGRWIGLGSRFRCVLIFVVHAELRVLYENNLSRKSVKEKRWGKGWNQFSKRERERERVTSSDSNRSDLVEEKFS